MKNVRVKVRKFTCTCEYDYGIYQGKKRLMGNSRRQAGIWGLTYFWKRKSYAISAAKAMAKRIGIKFDAEIVKQKGC